MAQDALLLYLYGNSGRQRVNLSVELTISDHIDCRMSDEW